MPYYELRSKLGMQGKTPDQIADGVQAAYVKGELPKRDVVSFAYMWSADQNLASVREARSRSTAHVGDDTFHGYDVDFATPVLRSRANAQTPASASPSPGRS